MSWSRDALQIVERSIERHGGIERWRRLERLALTPLAFTGLLPRATGLGTRYPLPARMDVAPSCDRVVFVDYPRAGEEGVFDNGRVALDGAPLAEHRGSFGAGKWRRWTALDALYFFGYALAHYHAAPFTLTDAALMAFGATRRSGAAHFVTVEFAPSLHTHCARQTFYFDASGLIVRHDYVAEVIGPWARGAHLWLDYHTVDGFPVAHRRHVLARIGRQPLPVTILDARFAHPRSAE